MKEISGLFNTALVFADDCEDYAAAQIKKLCDNPIFKDSKIRIMPDVHPGKYCVIGTTMTICDYVIPFLVGVDIGCGMTCVRLKNNRFENQQMDAVITESVPSGSAIHKVPHRHATDFNFSSLRCVRSIHQDKAERSLGTLGGGNHFIELSKAADGSLYLVIHSGSRHLGVEVATYYQDAAYKALKQKGFADISYPDAYLEGSLLGDYVHDMQIVQAYAALNRSCIADSIIRGMKFKVTEEFSTLHNYIEHSDDGLLLRKGAVSAKKGETLLIPVNMRDGSLLCVGKGNSEWNDSAPHGSGRIASRSDTESKHTVSEFKKEMKGIYCSVISKDTLDEAPFAYRDISTILQSLHDTVDVVDILKPLYNFKAGS